MIKITKARDFTRDHDYKAFSVVRVFNGCLSSLGGRNAWVVIRGNNVTLYRRAQGAGGVAALPKTGIELDYDSRLELGLGGRPDEDGYYTCDLEIVPARFVDRILAHWNHPSLEYQLPYRLAVLSVVLGGVGFLLGIAGVIIGIQGLK